MLRQALELLPPRGRLVYATCSLEPEENEQVVQEVLANVVIQRCNISHRQRPGSFAPSPARECSRGRAFRQRQ